MLTGWVTDRVGGGCCRYEQDAEGFKSRVAESIAVCKADLYTDPDPSDPHSIKSAIMCLLLSVFWGLCRKFKMSE